MAVTVSTIELDSAIEVAVSEKLHKEDYAVFVPVLEKAIEAHGKIRLLFDMHDFHGWDAAALWEEVKFDMKHFKNFERVAMVGDKKWQRAMAAFSKPFITGKVKYFDCEEKSLAREWLLSDGDPE